MVSQTRSENWDGFWAHNTGSRYTRKSWSKIRMMHVLKPFTKPGLKVLDAGCGSGFFSGFFLSEGCEVTALDYSDQALGIVRRTTEGKCREYLKEDLLDPEWGRRHASQFDLIFTDGLFEHFSSQDQQKILAHFKEAKTKDGLIATFVPNRFSWWEIVRPFVMPGIHEEPFTPRSLRQMHREFILIKSGGLNVLPWALSPEGLLGNAFGMILYCIAR